MADRDPYRIIGIPPISNDSDIKKAYRAKSKMYHPDLNPDLKIWADEKMKELVEAYNLISDPEKKKAYDLSYNLQYRRDRKKKQKKKAVQKTFWDKVMDFINGTNVPKKPKQSSKPTKQLKGKKREIEYDPKEAETHFGLGISMCDTLSFLDQAMDSFKRATEYDPEHLEAHYNFGIANYRSGNWGEAISSFQKVLKIDPLDEGAKHMLNILKEDEF